MESPVVLEVESELDVPAPVESVAMPWVAVAVAVALVDADPNGSFDRSSPQASNKNRETGKMPLKPRFGG